MRDATVVFDRFTVVILWNAGCAGCLPVVEQVSAHPELSDAACFAIAVMVRDVETTKEAALSSCAQAVLALEERPAASTLFRGSVTRNWLEPSGQFGVPASYAINSAGQVLWIGASEELPALLPKLRSDGWDVGAARREWLATNDMQAIARNRVNREVTELLVAGMTSEALTVMDDAERHMPAIVGDKEYTTLKFSVLAEIPDCLSEAMAHYAFAAQRFVGDAEVQTALAAVVLSKFSSHDLALEIAINQLTLICSISGQARPISPATAWAFLQLAEILKFSGRTTDAMRHMDQLEGLLGASGLHEQVKRWIEGELARVRTSVRV